MIRYLAALSLPVFLAACGPGESVWASDKHVARAMYRHDGAPALTLYTMVNNRSGSGAHSALMVNGSQRVIFDPAGSFGHETIPERNDVIIGATPRIEGYFVGYHARETFHVISQRIEVSPQVAEMALQRVMTYGAVPKAGCSRAVTDILNDLPGLQSINQTFFPKNAMQQFARLPGVTTQKHYEDDADDKTVAREAYVPDES
ncbi:hypothetical protein [Parasulfitobacter algicola]|uniref:Lipoprotein n=1 Tax=Parasulfitobacter algicola TaxID=2614809 RepID=A0ABX2IMQ6_9RHOB|nr:hypothetical protein [Sulfitobacter algicola]NSX53820.1 hypothetical protein [Sulfitobacter algicola]